MSLPHRFAHLEIRKFASRGLSVPFDRAPFELPLSPTLSPAGEREAEAPDQ